AISLLHRSPELFFDLLLRPPPRPCSTLSPYTTLFRSRWRGSNTTTAHSTPRPRHWRPTRRTGSAPSRSTWAGTDRSSTPRPGSRSEEHTSELQSRFDLVCRLLLEKKNVLAPE